MAGQHQPDVDAAPRRVGEGVEQLRVGHEVGVGQVDVAAATSRSPTSASGRSGCADRRACCRSRAPFRRPGRPARGRNSRWRAARRPASPTSRTNSFWKSSTTGPSIRRCVSRQASCASRLAARARRPDDPPEFTPAEIDSADEGDAPVDHQQLAVVPVVEQPSLPGRQRVDRIELEHLHAAVPSGGRRTPSACRWSRRCRTSG